MKNNVVDNLGDEYFMSEYRGALYIHENKLYKLRGFNVNGVLLNSNSRDEITSNLKKVTFNNDINELIDWIDEQNAELAVLMDDEPTQYHTWEDDDGNIREDEETSEDWDEWDEQVRHIRKLISAGEELKSKWNETEKTTKIEYLDFLPLYNKTAPPLLIPVKEFTSLKGFNIPEGFVNLEKRAAHITYRRSYKPSYHMEEEILENPENARQLVNPTYPTLKEAVFSLKSQTKTNTIAISKKLVVQIEATIKKGQRKFLIYDKNNEHLADWLEGSKTITARNSKIMAVLSKKG